MKLFDVCQKLSLKLYQFKDNAAMYANPRNYNVKSCVGYLVDNLVAAQQAVSDEFQSSMHYLRTGKRLAND